MRTFAMHVAAVLVVPTAVWAAPGLQIDAVDGKLLIRAEAARMAAWRPSVDGLIVVVPAGGEVKIGTLPATVNVQRTTDNGLQAVLVRGVESSWKVVQDGTNWLVRPGTALKSESAVMLNDSWLAGNETLRPQSLRAFGKDWQVALAERPVSMLGSVVGGVRMGAAGRVSAAAVNPAAGDEPVPAKTTTAAATTGETPAAKAPLQAVNVGDVMTRGTKVDEVAVKAPPSLPSKPSATAVEAAVAQSGLAKVSVHPAPSMRPMALEEVESELLPRVLGKVYVPGTLVSLTLPKGMSGLGTPLVDQEKKRDVTTVSDTHAADTHGVEAAGEVLAAHSAEPPAETPDVGAEAHGDETVTASSDVTPSKVSGTWNQVTLEPVKASLEAEKQRKIDEEKAREGRLDVKIPDMAAVEPIPDVPARMVEGLFPVRGKSYVSDSLAALRAIAERPADSAQERAEQMNMAAVYLNWDRPEEALAVLRELPVREDKLPASPAARLLMGVAMLARDEVPDAKLFDQGGPLGADGKLWRAVAASRLGDYATALKLWPEERGILPKYPAYMREMAQEAQASALVMSGNRKAGKAVLEELIKGYHDPKDVPAALNRLRGLVRLGTPEESEGLEYLAAAAEDMRDPKTAYRAKFEFVRALYQRRDLSDEQVISYLRDLWFDWRGDDLEQDVLYMLGDMYAKTGDSRMALQYWQTLVKAFPRSPNLRQVTEKMGDAFVHVFDPENPHTYDPLEYVGLYYDFSELVPHDARGDLIHEHVARLLIDANLWARAVPILESQLKFRPLDMPTQARLSLMLAEAYGNMGKAAEGIKIIDKWQHAANTQVLAREWKLVEADLLLRLKRPQAVQKALAKMPNDDAAIRDLRIEAAWMAKDWKTIVPLLEARLEGVTPAAMVGDRGAQVAAFRLGYVYGELRDATKLDALTVRYADVMNRLPVLGDGLGAVAASTGISASLASTGPLAPVTVALSDLNRLTDRVQVRRAEIAQQREEQQEYNDKMKYMELLPPPAL
ncbi:MAG: hypothetical protein DI628_07265 [Blastochloris viridis]|uniref:Uncharacterized protein n=1 Tax=Blastochloris viridis TaxID=1079 RepID=A0A6N4RC79_BLAVI|nr:MAG: hypothetical protein DI628_07265 [Blastochloris viridis]